MNDKTETVGPDSIPLPVLVGEPRQEKREKGRWLSYYQLSYRGKFYRTLWTAPFIALLFVVPLKNRPYWIIGSIVGVIVQAAYNYYRWRAEERQ